jgi:hypothetical protein
VFRFRPQTTPQSKKVPWESVVITLPVHPLAGQSVVVEGLKRQSGRQYVRVRHPDGSVLAVPVDWTDRWPQRCVPEVGTRRALLDPRRLQRAARVVADWQSRVGEKIDACNKGVTLAAGGADRRAPRMGATLGDDPGSSSGSMGAPGSTGARGIGHRGGK